MVARIGGSRMEFVFAMVPMYPIESIHNARRRIVQNLQKPKDSATIMGHRELFAKSTVASNGFRFEDSVQRMVVSERPTF
jgi:hypothetical protein